MTDRSREAEYERLDRAEGAEVDRLIAEIASAESALKKLAEGTYGFCEDCAQAIAAGRLQAQPTARRCRACQEISENRTRRRPAPV